MLVDILTMNLLFFLFPLKMSVNMGCAWKPLFPEAHLQIHPPADRFICLLCPEKRRGRVLCTTAPCPPAAPSTTADPGAALEVACQAEQRPCFLFFKGSIPRLGKPQGRVKVTSRRKRTNFPNKLNHSTTVLVVWHMNLWVQNGNN